MNQPEVYPLNNKYKKDESPLSNLGSRVTDIGISTIYGGGADVTLDKLPRQSKIAAELLNVGYNLVQQYGRTSNNVNKVPLSGFEQAMNKHLSEDTLSFVGDLLPQYSNSNILIFRRASDGYITAAVRGTHTGSFREVSFDAKKIALLDNASRSNLFEEYFSILRQIQKDFGKTVDVIMGDSLGGNIAITASDLNLAARSVSLNPYIRPSSIGDGYNTIFRTQRDIALLSKEGFFNTSNSTEQALLRSGPNTTIDIVPSSQSTSINPLNQIGQRINQHSIDNFIPEKSGVPLESGDSFLPDQRLLNIRNFEKRAEQAAIDAGSNRYKLDGPSKLARPAKIVKGVGKFGGKIALNVAGAMVTEELLNAAGIEGEFTHDVVDSIGGGLVEGGVIGGATAYLGGESVIAAAGLGAASAVPGAIVAGTGIYAGGTLANEIGVDGWGKRGLEFGGAVLNTGLAYAAATGLTPIGIGADIVLAAEAGALFVDKLIHHEHEQKLTQATRDLNISRNRMFHDREDAIKRMVTDRGINYGDLPYTDKYNLNKMKSEYDLNKINKYIDNLN